MMKKLWISMLAVFQISIAFAQQDPPLTISSMSQANELIEKLKNSTIPQLREIHQCYVDAKSFVDEYAGAKMLWVGKDSLHNLPLAIDADLSNGNRAFDTNLYRNFDGLIAYQTKFFADLEIFIRDSEKEPAGDLASLKQHILELDRGRTKLVDVNVKVAKKYSEYLWLLSSVKGEAEIYQKRASSQVTEMLASRCKNAGLDPIANFLDSDVKKIMSNLEKLRSFTLDAIEKRNAIVARTLQELRGRYVNEYKNVAERQLGDLADSASDVLELARAGEEMLNWWVKANTNGLADSLHLKYLQFEGPRDLLLIEMQRALEFEASIKSFKNAPSSMQAVYLSKLSTFKNVIEENLRMLSERGWKGQLDRQVMLNKKRLEASSRLQPECIAAISKHLDVANKGESLEKFRATEVLYTASLKICSARG